MLEFGTIDLVNCILSLVRFLGDQFVLSVDNTPTIVPCYIKYSLTVN